MNKSIGCYSITSKYYIFKKLGWSTANCPVKREVAGTSKIEGAEFTDKELDAEIAETPEQLNTRSQRQAAAAKKTYRWIQGLPLDRPIDSNLILEIEAPRQRAAGNL